MKQLQNITDTRRVFVIDAFRYSLYLENKAYQSLMRAVRRIERADDGKSHPHEAVALNAIASSWQILDITHRIRGLLTQILGLSQKKPEVQVFRRNTSAVEGFRHLYQHLNSEISSVSGKTNPVMGALSWVTSEQDTSITVFVGTGTPDVQVHTVAFDTWESRFAQCLLFSAANKDIELDKIHLSCRALNRFIDKWLKASGYLTDQNVEPSILRFKIARAV